MNVNKPLRFHNGRFTVLQVSDPQDLQFVRGTMLKMLARAYDVVQPDLIVLTGDQILGNHLHDCNMLTRLTVRSRGDELRAIRSALGKLLRPIEERKIPFAMVFGNHDDMNRISKEEHAAVYASYGCCVGLNTEDPSVDCDTYCIPVLSEDGTRTAYALWMLDSARYDKTERRSYHWVTPETVAWLKKSSKALTKENNGTPVPGILFQHIPLRETLQLIETCTKKQASICENGIYYRLRENVQGVLGEYPSVCEKEADEFNVIKNSGVRAVVFGHDHANSFTGKLDGIDFVQTGGASFRCYGSSAARSVRIFTLYENGGYETYTLSYWQLCGKNPVSALRYYWDADEMAKIKYGSLGAFLLTCAGAAGMTIAVNKIRK